MKIDIVKMKNGYIFKREMIKEAEMDLRFTSFVCFLPGG